MAHCMPLLDRPRSAWILGAAIETIVWSMKVIATAKIIAVRIRLRDRPPAAVLTLIVFLPALKWPADLQCVHVQPLVISQMTMAFRRGVIGTGPLTRGQAFTRASVSTLIAARFPASSGGSWYRAARAAGLV